MVTGSVVTISECILKEERTDENNSGVYKGTVGHLFKGENRTEDRLLTTASWFLEMMITKET